MINYDSILSAFDGKPTLLQWLKMVKKALDESILKNVYITQNGEKVVFTFNFEDGTSISTPEVTLPKGDKGDTGATGPKGNDGVSITGIDTVSGEVVGDETLTTLRANYSNNTSNEFVVTAKNGSVTAGNLYLHHVRIGNNNHYENISFEVYSSKQNLTLQEALEYIPTISPDTDINSNSANKILVYYQYGNSSFGSVGAVKYLSDGNFHIKLIGIAYISSNNSVQKQTSDFAAFSITDTLIGVNL